MQRREIGIDRVVRGQRLTRPLDGFDEGTWHGSNSASRV
jgi:hypothetical protein